MNGSFIYSTTVLLNELSFHVVGIVIQRQRYFMLQKKHSKSYVNSYTIWLPLPPLVAFVYDVQPKFLVFSRPYASSKGKTRREKTCQAPRPSVLKRQTSLPLSICP